eukprot:TRINITY_DN3956_c0_g1_i1.p1 TRINITY_DN3956_c0_g1~~TRINITY_DN3956_c0_g1_i1.p1  ORF type:complete len:1130 (-),score=341.71 TRINITY_DN3956_c0_g1_i1:159-3548(-)
MSQADAGKILGQCLTGEIAEANALPQLLHLHKNDPKGVIAALLEKANAIVQQSDAGHAAARAGSLLVSVAVHIDRQLKEEAAQPPPAKKNNKGAKQPAAPQNSEVHEVSRPLLDHILLLSGGKNRAAKDKAVRAQGCTLISSLATAVPDHKGAEDKLIEFALDRVPTIREKAVRGLAGVDSPTSEMALIARTTDPCTAVRASAVRGLRVSASTAGTLLERIDDVEACVRAQLFMRFADQPSAVEELGPAALARLVAGLTDRSSSVRGAAGNAVDGWVKHLGGVLNLLSRCDVTSDEALGEAAAAALAARYPEEGTRIARLWLGQVTSKDAKILPDGPAPVLFARLAIAGMTEEARDEVLDVPSLLSRTEAALEAAQRKDTSSTWHEYLLRQLLHVVALADICDETLRREVDRVAEAVLFRAPLSNVTLAEVGTAAATCRMAQSAIDLGIVILRKCSGLTRFQAQTTRHQVVEARCSTRVVLLLSELAAPSDQPVDGDDEGDHSFTTRLSLQIQELNGAIEQRQKTKVQIDATKKKALQKEDYIQAQKLKEQARKNEKELEGLGAEKKRLIEQRDSACLRVLAISSALLRWSNSDIRKDPALFGILQQILMPLVQLPALTKEVEVAAVCAVCLFCVRDGQIARQHWTFLLTLLRGLQSEGEPGAEGKARLAVDRARAAVASRAISDCARLHGAVLAVEEAMSAVSALAAVPFHSRQVVLEPLCGWLLSLGHIFFEAHLFDPVPEVTWALGWMLIEAFKQRRQPSEVEAEERAEGQRRLLGIQEENCRKRGLSWVTRPDQAAAEAKEVVQEEQQKEDVEEDPAEAIAMASRLTQFFALLPKLPGKHGAPMLSLAVESIAESGLWRRGCLMPHTLDGQTRWLRGFSWPELFAFVHDRVPVEMRFRLWRCSLQICVSSPALAPFAEIPFALAAAADGAPPGAAELLAEALELGADPDALAGVKARLPKLPEVSGKKSKAAPLTGVYLDGAEAKLLLAPDAGIQAEKERRAELFALGIKVDDWAPADLEVPKMVPQHHRMRAAPRKPRGTKRAAAEAAATQESVQQENQPNNSPSSESDKASLRKIPVPLAPPEPEAEQENGEEQEGPEKKRTRRVGKQAELSNPARAALRTIR